MNFGEHLRGLREAAGLPREELARRAGVPASTLRNWEGDRGFPDLTAALRLAAALGVPVVRGSCRPSLRPNVLKRLGGFEEDFLP
jgi:transcriptional regulator with XRE-family HTH domain